MDKALKKRLLNTLLITFTLVIGIALLRYWLEHPQPFRILYLSPLIFTLLLLGNYILKHPQKYPLLQGLIDGSFYSALSTVTAQEISLQNYPLWFLIGSMGGYFIRKRMSN